MAAKHIKFSAEARNETGKGVARALRRENKIPAVIYGDGKEPVKISLSARDANVEYNRGHIYTTLSDIDVDGTKHLTLVRDVQTDPVKDFVMHIDFLRVTSKTKIAVNVPVQFINEDQAPYVHENGILNVTRYEIEIRCKATAIPEYIEADLSGLNIGDSVKSSDIKWPEGATPVIDDREFTIATIAAPKTAEEEEAEAEENAEDIESAGEEDGEEGEAGEASAEGDGEEAKSEE
jgi:large subunit ribosomal protein L25